MVSVREKYFQCVIARAVAIVHVSAFGDTFAYIYVREVDFYLGPKQSMYINNYELRALVHYITGVCRLSLSWVVTFQEKICTLGMCKCALNLVLSR